MALINYGEETINALEEHDYTIQDIDWIGSQDCEVDVEDFFKQANQYYYDNGYGRIETPINIMIFMKDGSRFIRREYDGAEWWEYVPTIKRPTHVNKIKSFDFEYPLYLPMLEHCIK